jgi:hypothetical protein
MIINRLQFLALWLGGLAIVAAIAIQTPSAPPASAAASGRVSPGPAGPAAQGGADSAAVATILSVLAPDAAAADPAAGELTLESLPEGDFSRPVVAAIVEERGVFSVYLRDTENVSALRVGDTWQEWRISEIRPDGVYFESEDLPFDFRVFVNVEEAAQ